MEKLESTLSGWNSTSRTRNNPAWNPRHIEGDDDRVSCRDRSHDENLNIERALQSTGVNDGDKSVNQEEGTSTSPSTQ